MAFILMMLWTGCTVYRDTVPPEPAAGPALLAYPIVQAIRSADDFLQANRLNWGRPQQVLRTGSGWYRIEYQHDNLDRERVVLVDPGTRHAEFPLPR